MNMEIYHVLSLSEVWLRAAKQLTRTGRDLDPIQADPETHACSQNASLPPRL